MQRRADGHLYQPTERDKYHFQGAADVDCAARIPFCHAVCCRLPFALSEQDVVEGVVQWDPAQPYLIRQEADGRCTHQDRGTGFCSIHARRPVPCRAFTCEHDERIWLDFDAMIVNPAINDEIWPFGFGDNLSRDNLPG
jgi:Fe-S-cluster containining protein